MRGCVELVAEKQRAAEENREWLTSSCTCVPSAHTPTQKTNTLRKRKEGRVSVCVCVCVCVWSVTRSQQCGPGHRTGKWRAGQGRPPDHRRPPCRECAWASCIIRWRGKRRINCRYAVVHHDAPGVCALPVAVPTNTKTNTHASVVWEPPSNPPSQILLCATLYARFF